MSILLFSLFNPLGPPVPTVLAAQIIVMAGIGACGSLWGRLAATVGKPELLAAVFGGALTLLYGLAADYGFAISMGRWTDPLPVIAAGFPFSILHIVSNALIFGGVSVFVVRKYRLRVENEHR